MVHCHVFNCFGSHHPKMGCVDATYSWATVSCCDVCHKRGYMCRDGCAMRKAFTTRRQLTRHNYRKHTFTTPENLICDDGTNVPDCRLVKPIRLHGSVALQSFLDRAQMAGMISAIRHLVARACFSSDTLTNTVINAVPLHDTYIVLLTARLVFRIGTVHQVLLCSLLSVLVQSRPQRGPSSLAITHNQMRKVISG
jgi:hypothetical protein